MTSVKKDSPKDITLAAYLDLQTAKDNATTPEFVASDSDANRRPVQTWFEEQKEQKETSGVPEGIRDVKNQLLRVRRIAIENKKLLSAHESNIERLDSEKLSQNSLDTALRHSTHLSDELRNIQTCVDGLLNIATTTEQQLDDHEKDIETLQSKIISVSSLNDALKEFVYLSAKFERLNLRSHSPTALDEDVNRLKEFVDTEPSNKKLGDRQIYLKNQLKEVFKVQEQLKLYMRQKNSPQPKESSNLVNRMSTANQQLRVLKKKLLKCEKDFSRNLTALKVKIDPVRIQQDSLGSQITVMKNKLDSVIVQQDGLESRVRNLTNQLEAFSRD